jgi:hypothetical protein
MAGVLINRILEDLFDLFFGNPVLTTMLHVAVRIVTQVPNDEFKGHTAALRVLYYNTTPQARVKSEYFYPTVVDKQHSRSVVIH